MLRGMLHRFDNAVRRKLFHLQVAMAKLKAAVRTIGDHKQRITVNVSLEGIKIIDEKTEVSAVCFSFQLMNVLTCIMRELFVF